MCGECEVDVENVLRWPEAAAREIALRASAVPVGPEIMEGENWYTLSSRGHLGPTSLCAAWPMWLESCCSPQRVSCELRSFDWPRFDAATVGPSLR